jgi:type IV pilus assembly protein PilW
MYSKSTGFSLVELMVAMVIGLIIILGAGQLFLTVFQSGRQVEALGEKQAALNFAAEVLLRDIRRSFWSASEWDGEVLLLIVPNRGDSVGCEDLYKEYFVAQGDSDNFLSVRQGCALDELGGGQEIVGGFADGGFQVEPVPDDATSLAEGHGALIRFVLSSQHLPNDDIVEFYAINRTAAVQGATITGDPSGGGAGGGDDENDSGDESGSENGGDENDGG